MENKPITEGLSKGLNLEYCTINSGKTTDLKINGKNGVCFNRVKIIVNTCIRNTCTLCIY